MRVWPQHIIVAMSDKVVVDQVEEARSRHGRKTAQHGDRALALIGNERVSLTDEDVLAQAIGSMTPS